MVFRLQAGREQIAEMIKDSGGQQRSSDENADILVHWIAGQIGC